MHWLLVFLIASSQVKEDQTGKIHKVYSQEGEIYYQIFDGKNWSEPINLSNSPEDPSYDPVIEIRGEIITVEWKEEHNGRVYIMRRRKLMDYPKWTLPHIIDSFH
jgi:3-polyprenyl-4-hydroxybenzoate decarboxylase